MAKSVQLPPKARASTTRKNEVADAAPAPKRKKPKQKDHYLPANVRRALLKDQAVPFEIALGESVALRSDTARAPTRKEVERLEAKGRDVLFSNMALKETLALVEPKAELSARERLQGVVFSIDGKGTKDLDNAMSFRKLRNGNLVVGVHAVDLSAFVRPGSALDMAARRRMETRYQSTAGLVLPMLPLSLCEDRLSLFEGKDRLGKSVELEFTPEGELVGRRIFRSALHNQFQLDPETAEEALNGEGRGKKNPELTVALDALTRLAARASGQNDPDARMGLEAMLAFFTVRSAESVGLALRDADLETLYRNQSNRQEKSIYGTEAEGHKGLGVDAYARWTGPMRRYADLEVQRAMDRLIDNDVPQGRKAALVHDLVEITVERANNELRDKHLASTSQWVRITRVEDDAEAAAS